MLHLFSNLQMQEHGGLPVAESLDHNQSGIKPKIVDRWVAARSQQWIFILRLNQEIIEKEVVQFVLFWSGTSLSVFNFVTSWRNVECIHKQALPLFSFAHCSGTKVLDNKRSMQRMKIIISKIYQKQPKTAKNSHKQQKTAQNNIKQPAWHKHPELHNVMDMAHVSV